MFIRYVVFVVCFVFFFCMLMYVIYFEYSGGFRIIFLEFVMIVNYLIVYESCVEIFIVVIVIQICLFELLDKLRSLDIYVEKIIYDVIVIERVLMQ